MGQKQVRHQNEGAPRFGAESFLCDHFWCAFVIFEGCLVFTRSLNDINIHVVTSLRL